MTSQRQPQRPTPTPERLEVSPVEPLLDAELPRCSIVVLNWNGLHHLDACFESVRGLDYPEDLYELILVDNGSDDGSQAHVKRTAPWVRLIENQKNHGFAGGCNIGVANTAEPELLIFLNNDLKVEPGFLRALVAPIVHGECEAVTGRMLDWDGKTLDSAGGGMNFHGFGIQRGYQQADGPEFQTPRLSLFACGGAMAIRAKVYRELGGFDDSFFAYYEDVDLGWRMWVSGYSVRYEPAAVCYHHHSSTSRRLPPEMLRRLQVRNPLLACFKNYDDENLARVFPTMISLATRRALLSGGPLDGPRYRIEELSSLPSPGLKSRLQGWFRKHRQSTQEVNRILYADLLAINDLLGAWEHWSARRAEIQARRRRPDAEILPLFLRPLWCIEDDPGYRALHAGAADRFGLQQLFDGMTTLPEEPPR